MNACFLSGFRIVLPFRTGWSRGLRTVLLILLVVSFAIRSVQAQDDRKPTNLQVFDTSMTHDQVIAVMRDFSAALGVGCDHCHARPPEGQREIDFASDSNRIKLTAREMVRMTKVINKDYLTNLPATSDTSQISVRCVTCHHGQPRPLLLQDVLKEIWAERGVAALDSTYRDLRKRYYGGFTYDFSDHVLAVLALELADQSGPDAMAVLKLNREFNPDSYVNEWATGRVFLIEADTASALAALKRALEINPDFRRAQHDLQMLTGE